MAASGFDHNIILKACNRAAASFDLESGIKSVNYNFEGLFKDSSLKELEDILKDSFKREDPTLYPIHIFEQSYIVVVLPMIHSKKEDTRLAFVLPTDGNSIVDKIELDKDSYHYINNPLAIIYMQFIVPKKSMTMDQDQVDKLFNKLRDSFQRIEDYIIEVIQTHAANK